MRGYFPSHSAFALRAGMVFAANSSRRRRRLHTAPQSRARWRTTRSSSALANVNGDGTPHGRPVHQSIRLRQRQPGRLNRPDDAILARHVSSPLGSWWLVRAGRTRPALSFLREGTGFSASARRERSTSAAPSSLRHHESCHRRRSGDLITPHCVNRRRSRFAALTWVRRTS